MNLTLKEKLDLQRQAKIITESQYKKLLNENDSTNQISSTVPTLVKKIESSPEFDKMVLAISKNPAATKQLMSTLSSFGINPESLNESTENAAEILSSKILKQAEEKFGSDSTIDEDRDMTGTFSAWFAGLVGGGTLGPYLAQKFQIFTELGHDLWGKAINVPEGWVLPAAAIAGSLLAALASEVIKKIKDN
jgi:hypothetical protein